MRVYQTPRIEQSQILALHIIVCLSWTKIDRVEIRMARNGAWKFD
uniref:Uncharacterized protein n=1 Tax=Rhizophora mucronata TaxID=61149 RepID=A0A2P2N6R4_RHIMU